MYQSVIQIDAGYHHNIAVADISWCNSGKNIRVWGDNTYGQLLRPTNLTGVKKVSAGAFHNIVLLENGSLAGWGGNVDFAGEGEFGSSFLADVPPSGFFADISANNLWSMALQLPNRTLTGWGGIFDGQDGWKNSPTLLTGVKKISAGYFHSLAILENNQLTGWGAISREDQIPIFAGGQYQTAVENQSNRIFISNDFGLTWLTAPNLQANWQSISTSLDGSIQMAVARNNGIYKSEDYGSSWSLQTGAPTNRGWKDIAISDEGSRQTAIMWSGNPGDPFIENNPQIFNSIDYGETWIPRLGGQNWFKVAMSDDGLIQTAVANGGGIFVSSLFGVSWAQTFVGGSWVGIDMSANGQIQTAVAASGPIHRSLDYGNTWSVIFNQSLVWSDVAVSSDGKYQTACVYGGRLYVSNDSGINWSARGPAQNLFWESVSIEGSGQYQSAVGLGTQIYISEDFGETWVPKDQQRSWKGISLNRGGEAWYLQTPVSPGFDENNNTIEIPNLTNVIDISAGKEFSLALLSGGIVTGWGNNDYGQVTIPPQITGGIIKISAGGYHSLALDENNNVIAWGRNDWGQTNVPNDIQFSGLVDNISAGYGHSIVSIRTGPGGNVSGQISGWGLNTYINESPGLPVNIIGITNNFIFCKCEFIECGGDFILANCSTENTSDFIYFPNCETCSCEAFPITSSSSSSSDIVLNCSEYQAFAIYVGNENSIKNDDIDIILNNNLLVGTFTDLLPNCTNRCLSEETPSAGFCCDILGSSSSSSDGSDGYSEYGSPSQASLEFINDVSELLISEPLDITIQDTIDLCDEENNILFRRSCVECQALMILPEFLLVSSSGRNLEEPYEGCLTTIPPRPTPLPSGTSGWWFPCSVNGMVYNFSFSPILNSGSEIYDFDRTIVSLISISNSDCGNWGAFKIYGIKNIDFTTTQKIETKLASTLVYGFEFETISESFFAGGSFSLLGQQVISLNNCNTGCFPDTDRFTGFWDGGIGGLSVNI
jgi:hypothetical protein